MSLAQEEMISVFDILSLILVKYLSEDFQQCGEYGDIIRKWIRAEDIYTYRYIDRYADRYRHVLYIYIYVFWSHRHDK